MLFRNPCALEEVSLQSYRSLRFQHFLFVFRHIRFLWNSFILGFHTQISTFYRKWIQNFFSGKVHYWWWRTWQVKKQILKVKNQEEEDLWPGNNMKVGVVQKHLCPRQAFFTHVKNSLFSSSLFSYFVFIDWSSGRAGRENIWLEVMTYGPSALSWNSWVFAFCTQISMFSGLPQFGDCFLF